MKIGKDLVPVLSRGRTAAPVAPKDPEPVAPIDQLTRSAAVGKSPTLQPRTGSQTATQVAGSLLPGAAGVALLTLPDGTRKAYPQAVRGTDVDSYQGIQVSDPYRSLETTDSPTTKSFVSQENRLTRAYLDRLPQREQIQSAVTGAIPRDKRSLPDVVGDRMFYVKSSGQENQAVICTADLDGQGERVLFDPNPLSKNGLVAINSFRVSPDGSKLAYGVMRNGSDWMQWKIRDVASGEDLPGKVAGTKYGDNISWSPDSQGIFYPKFERAKGHAALTAADKDLGDHYHRIGTTEGKDLKVGSPGCPPEPKPDPVDAEGNSWHSLGKLGQSSVFQVGGSIRVADGVDKKTPEGLPVQSRVLLPEGKDSLQGVTVVKDRLVAHYLEDGHSRLEEFDAEGKSLGPIALPGLGSINGLRTVKDQLMFDYSAPAYPPTVFRCAPEGKPEVLFQAKVDYDPNQYETSLKFGTSRDGTQVPLYVTRRKDSPQDGQRPTYLYGYGGFDVNEVPENKANLNIIPWLDRGNVFVDACLRGGGEYGEQWHQDGMTVKKQNVFDDLIGSGESLVRMGITTPKHLGVGGRSNGGLLAAATTLERPDLFAASIPEVGVMDLMRFPRYTSGVYWVSEYGTTDKKVDVANMLTYSPVHNVHPGWSYPSMMIITGDHDDRVVPSHSYKLATELQQAQGADKPVLLKVERNAGHGSSDHPWPRAKLIKQDTDRWSFLAHALETTAG